LFSVEPGEACTCCLLRQQTSASMGKNAQRMAKAENGDDVTRWWTRTASQNSVCVIEIGRVMFAFRHLRFSSGT
jgi:hypothetical protein